MNKSKKQKKLDAHLSKKMDSAGPGRIISDKEVKKILEKNQSNSASTSSK